MEEPVVAEFLSCLLHLADPEREGIPLKAAYARTVISFDLLVSGWRGDVKTSTYFLVTARTRALRHDFYITRLYDRERRHRVWAVIMQPEVWAAINGETKVVDLSQAHQRFPTVSCFYHRNHRLVVAAYETWKAKILTFQRRSK